MLFKKRFLGTMSVALVAMLVATGCGKNTASDDKKEESKPSVEIQAITTADVEKNVGNSDYVFVDTRNDSYYNGFKEGDQKRGGHIEGAVQYTADWVGKVNKEKLAKFVEDKGIAKDKKIVVYDTNADNVKKVGSMLKELGYDVYGYDKFGEYVSNDKDKLVAFPKYDQLVNATWTKDMIDGKNPESMKNKDYMLFEVSWGPTDKADSYKKEHIKGAYHFNTDWIENGPVWNLSSPEVVEKNLVDNGITKDKTIVLYSEDQSAAFRVMFALKWAGVNDVKVLNGGLNAWKDAKYPTEDGVNTPEKAESFGVKVPANPSIDIATAKEAYNLMQEGKLKLISNRAWDEYTGKISGYDYIKRKGEPKGAIFGFAGKDSSDMSNFYDPDGTLRNPLEMMALWESQGIKKDDNAAFYCGTGWRASISWEMTQMLGYDNFKLFDGGWNDWQMDKNLPVQSGAPNGEKEPSAKNDFQ